MRAKYVQLRHRQLLHHLTQTLCLQVVVCDLLHRSYVHMRSCMYLEHPVGLDYLRSDACGQRRDVP